MPSEMPSICILATVVWLPLTLSDGIFAFSVNRLRKTSRDCINSRASGLSILSTLILETEPPFGGAINFFFAIIKTYRDGLC